MSDLPHNSTARRDDEWIEYVLRKDAQEHDREYLPDDGFTARVMSAIPAPTSLPAWRTPALAALWGVAGVGIVAALPGNLTDYAYDVLRTITTHHFTLQEIGLAVLSFAAVSWAGSIYALRHET